MCKPSTGFSFIQARPARRLNAGSRSQSSMNKVRYRPISLNALTSPLARGIGVMLSDLQGVFVIQQAIENMEDIKQYK